MSLPEPPDRVAYFVPRYGTDVIGGAESATRRLAENLADTGVEVSVYTTCAQQTSWVDHYPPGTTTVNGVTVHRFRAGARHPDFDVRSGPILSDPEHCSEEVADRWIDWQGPRCPDALDAVEASDAEIVVLYPYLYWPTVHGVRRLGRRTLLHPATHDEAAVRLPCFREVFARSGGLAYQTTDERRLTEALHPVTSRLPQAVVGLGVDVGDGTEKQARVALGLDDRPYLVYVGRLDDRKGTTFLASWFGAYKDRHPGPLSLVLAGPVRNRPPERDDIVVPGVVDETLKWGALRGALALVNPSAFESFSLQLVEAWFAGTAALVNATCSATSYLCAQSGGGLTFRSYVEFEALLERLSEQPALADRLGQAGQAYVTARYTWPEVINRYRHLLGLVASRTG